MRIYLFFLLFILLCVPFSHAYANLTAIPEIPPELTLDVNETFPIMPSSDSGAGGAGGAGGGALSESNVTGSVEDALNNETQTPLALLEELEQERKEQEARAAEKEARRNPNKEGSAAVTIEKNFWDEILRLLPLLGIIAVLAAIIIAIIINNRKQRKKTELPKQV